MEEALHPSPHAWLCLKYLAGILSGACRGECSHSRTRHGLPSTSALTQGEL